LSSDSVEIRCEVRRGDFGRGTSSASSISSVGSASWLGWSGSTGLVTVGTGGGEAGSSGDMLFIEDERCLVSDLVLSTTSITGASTEAVSFASSNSSYTRHHRQYIPEWWSQQPLVV
jgi:hypothetical protein